MGLHIWDARKVQQQQQTCNRQPVMPKENDITFLEDVGRPLGTLHDFTDALASEKKVTLAALTPVLDQIGN